MVGYKNVSKKEEIDDLLPVTRSRPGSASTGNRRYLKGFIFFQFILDDYFNSPKFYFFHRIIALPNCFTPTSI